MGHKESTALLSAISRIQSQFLDGSSSDEIAKTLLKNVVQLTESSYGFIAEVVESPDGQQGIKMLATSDIPLCPTMRKIFQQTMENKMALYSMDNLLGEVVSKEDIVILNDVSSLSKPLKYPEGHPSLESFMGIPVMSANRLVGIVGLANRKDGYSEATPESIRPLLECYGRILGLIQDNRERLMLQKRLSAVVDTAVDGIIVIDSHGKICSCNQAAERVFGYEQGALIGKSVDTLMPQPYRDHHMGYINNYMRTGDAKVIGTGRSVAGMRANGDVFPMQLSISGFVVDNERFFTGIIHDLTVERRIRGDLSRYKKTLDQIQDTVFIFDPESLYFSYVNQAAVNQVGFSEAELLHMHPYDLMPEYSESQFKTLVASILAREEESIQFITEHKSKDEKLIPVEVLLQYVEGSEDEVSRFVAVVRDVSERIKTEQALRESEQRLNQGQSFANIGIWDWDIKTGGLYWSERIAPLFGYEEGTLETSYKRFLELVHPDDRQMVDDAVNACVREGRAYEIEHRCIWPNGEVRWMLERGDVLRDTEGKPIRMLGAVHDVTDIKRAQEALISAKEEAERANQAKSQFLSSMSHELRTPLNAILGFAQLYQYDPDTTEGHRKHADEIYSAGLHLRRLIDDVLDLAKIEAGHLEISLEPVSLDDVIQECLALVSPLANSRNVDVIYKVQARDRLCVSADKTRLKQVLLNLLSNAIKYNHENGKVTLVCKEPTNGWVHISVEDTGIGIEKKNYESVFSPFSRIRSDVKEIEGTGIGLSITKQFVELMDGLIGFESEPGKGSVFWVEMAESGECISGEETIDIVKIHDNSDLRKHKHVLVVEDNATNRKVLSAQLSILGIIADVANDGQQALDMLERKRYDMVLTDVHMPRLNGYQLVEQIRKDDAYTDSHIPVIAITANALDEDKARCIEAGMDGHISKPIDINTLDAVFNKWLDLGQHPAIEEASPKKNAISKAPYTPVDLSKLRSMLVGEEGMVYSILESFIEEVPENIQTIHDACANKDASNVVFYAHRFKSAASSIGALRLAELCQSMETAGRVSDWERISFLEGDIDVEVQNVLYYLRTQMELQSCRERFNLETQGYGFALLVDDEPVALRLLAVVLESLGLSDVITASSGVDALKSVKGMLHDIDVIFCDLNMPEMDGIEFMRHLSKMEYKGAVILLSGESPRILNSAQELANSYHFKAAAGLAKPVKREDIISVFEGIAGSTPRRSNYVCPQVSPDELESAIKHDQMVVYYQPKVNPKTQEVVGVEGLVRWRYPGDGLVMPDQFIPLAEENGMIDSLTDIVLEKVFAQQAAWLKEGIQLNVSVNIAAGTIGRNLDFPERVIEKLHRYKLSPDNIIFEITESGVMSDITATLDTLVRLRLKGITLSIDDFGTGYSTFKQLQGIPFGELKIDRSFVMNAMNDASSRAILESSVVLGQKLDMTIVAEGVETQDDWDLIQALGCHEIQGYFVSRPLPVDDFNAWLQRWEKDKSNQT